MKSNNKLIALVGIIFVLSGCDSKLSKENREKIETLKVELAEARSVLAEYKKPSEVDSGHAFNEKHKKVVYTPTVYQSEIEKDFQDLASRFEVLEVFPLPDTGTYRVAFTSKRSGMAVIKEVSIPLVFFRAVYDPEGQYSQDFHTKMASRGYSVEFIRLFEQGEFIFEKKAILALYTESFG